MRIGAGLALAAAAVAGGLAGFWLAQQLDRGAPALASGTWLPRARPVGEFRLTDQSGQPFTRHELEGQPALVYSGLPPHDTGEGGRGGAPPPAAGPPGGVRERRPAARPAADRGTVRACLRSR